MRSQSHFRFRRKDGAVYFKLAPFVLAAAVAVVHGGASTARQFLLGNRGMMPAVAQRAPGRAEAFGFTARVSGTVADARVFVARGSHAKTLVVGIYKQAGKGTAARPGALITSGRIAKPNARRWNDVRLREVRVAKGTRYWIALLGVHGRLSFRDRKKGTATWGSRRANLTTLPRRFSVGPRWRTGPASVYLIGSITKSGASSGSGTIGGVGSSGTAPPHSAPGATQGTNGSPCAGARNTPGGADPWGGCFPGPKNTGVPAGTPLQNVPGQVTSGPGWSWSTSDGVIYVNSCGAALTGLQIAGSVVITNTATNGTHSSATPCVTITDSVIQGFVDNGLEYPNAGPLVMSDDTVDVPNTDLDRSPVSISNYYAWRLNVVGGRLGFACGGYCEIHDSWTHDGWLAPSFHYNAVGTNGNGGAPLVIDHDSLACSFQNTNNAPGVAGCSDDVGLFGDFAPVDNVTLDKNLFVSAANANGGVPYCFDGNNPNTGKKYPQATNEVVTDNVFQRGASGECGMYGPVYSWASGNGNVWSGNRWDDGAALQGG